MLLIGGKGLRTKALDAAGRIAQKTGCRIMAPGQNARVERGAGRVSIPRTPYPVDQAIDVFKDVRNLLLVGSTPPVAFFAYPGKPSTTTPPECEITTLCEPHEDIEAALLALADEIGAKAEPKRLDLRLPPLPTSETLDPVTIGAVVGRMIPDNAIVCDESVTTGRNFFASTEGARPHDWLQLCGGAIGEGMPMAIGAAIACPDRKVLNFQADGSGMYTLQSLWTEARENLNILTLVWANRAYRILRGELMNVGAENPGRKAHDMLSLDNPALDWVALAKGMGVEARRASTTTELIAAIEAGLRHKGPFLVEVVI